MTCDLSLSGNPVNRVFCVGVDSMNQASAADAISPTIRIIGRLRRIAGCPSKPWTCFSGLAKRSVASGADGVRSLLMAYLKPACS